MNIKEATEKALDCVKPLSGYAFTHQLTSLYEKIVANVTNALIEANLYALTPQPTPPIAEVTVVDELPKDIYVPIEPKHRYKLYTSTVPHWKPMSEAPRDGTYIILVWIIDSDYSNPGINIASWSKGDKVWECDVEIDVSEEEAICWQSVPVVTNEEVEYFQKLSDKKEKLKEEQDE